MDKDTSFRTFFHKKRIITFVIILAVILLAAFLLFFAGKSFQKASFSISSLQVCHLSNPIGIDESVPVFGWRMEGETKGLFQSAYRIKVADSPASLKKGLCLWDSGKRTSSLSAAIPYEGEPLLPKSRYYWEVTVWNQNNASCTSLEEAYFETGLMGSGMGDAKWISAAKMPSPEPYAESDYSYFIHYDADVADTSASFVFGANEGYYGNMYLCRIRNYEEQALFELLQMRNGGFANEGNPLQSLDITSLRDAASSVFSVDLTVEKEEMEIAVNGSKAGVFSIAKTPVGSVGCYKSRGVSYAFFDNILVKSADGAVLYEEDFETDNTIFSPCYVPLEKGRLKAGSGLKLANCKEDPAPYFYREFAVKDKEIAGARIYMTSLGSFSLLCNGQAVSEDYFAPGKLLYNQELTYVTYDVTSLLQKGAANALGILLLHGWYDRAVGYPETFEPWGSTNGLLGMLEIRYRDGETDTIVTNEDFLCSTRGAVRMDDIYQGEFYNAPLEPEGFGKAGFSAEGFLPASVDLIEETYASLPLTGKKNEPIREVAQLTPVTVSEPVKNVFVYDFGQNFAGTCRIKVTGNAGQILTLRYGEALNTEDLANRDDVPGTIFTESLLSAGATDYYVLKGAEEGESFTPKFTYHGFRYLQIHGLQEPLPLEDVQGIVLSSDLRQTGSFTCSNDLLNRFYENTVWSQRSNFMDNPTDCPQRDERHGWAGDAQIFSLAASYHMDTYNFYRKYLRELRLLQTDEGAFPDMAPRSFGYPEWDGRSSSGGNNCWGDAAVVISWNLYTQYGDASVLEENYDALCRWMQFLIDSSDAYIRDRGGYGDHLSLEDTPSALSDTAWCAHSAELLSKMAAVLKYEEDAAYYSKIYQNYKQAWQNAYVLPDGTTSCDTQTSYALGLSFSLFPEDLQKAATERLLLLSEYGDFHIRTGFSGIGYLLPALSENGLADTAYAFLLQEEYPSLLYPVKHGATTTYEQFGGYLEKEDGTYSLNGSLNHYAFGSPVSYFYTDILGIRSDEADPGFHHILLQPKFYEGLTFVKGSYDSVYGVITVEWEKTETGYTVLLEIPPNTTATLLLPGMDTSGNRQELVSGNYTFTVS